MSGFVACSRCSSDYPPELTMTLWDGQAYCEACVYSFSPKLAEYARSHPRLEETAPWDFNAVWWRAIRMELFVFALFGSMLGWLGYADQGFAGLAGGLAVTAVICLFQGGIQMPTFVWHTKRCLPTLIVENGQVTTYRGGERRRWCSGVVPLRDVRWRIGTSRQDSMLRGTLVPRQPVVILQWTWRLYGLPLVRVRLACGWTEGMRDVWVDFLEFAGVPKE